MRAPRGELHTVGRWLEERTRLQPEQVALEFEDDVLSYEELLSRAEGLSHQLGRIGLGPGDAVATLCENRPEQVALLFACALSRLALAPLNWRLAPAELAEQLDILAPKLLLASPALRDKAMEAVTLERGGKPPPPVEDLLAAGESAPAGEVVLPGARDDDPLLVIFTSGSTGRAKGAVLSHSNCFWTNLSLDATVPLGSDDVVLQVLPQCHVGGWNVQPLQALWKGPRLVLEPRFDAARALRKIAEKGVTTMMGVPTTYLMMAEEASFEAADLSSLRRVIVGGAAMPVPLLEAWQARGVQIVQGYGLTEAAPNVLCLPPDKARQKNGWAGKPYLYVEVALRPSGGGPFLEGPGQGEICVRGPNVFAGYLEDAQATSRVLDGEGWLRTGDLAERDEDGFYRIMGRSVEMFVSGGENVYPAEVENVLSGYEGVVEAAVLGVPHPRWGETGLAFVVPRAPALSADELERHCRRLLAAYKVPRLYVFVEELPRMSTGKLDRASLKARALLAARGEGSGDEPR